MTIKDIAKEILSGKIDFCLYLSHILRISKYPNRIIYYPCLLQLSTKSHHCHMAKQIIIFKIKTKHIITFIDFYLT